MSKVEDYIKKSYFACRPFQLPQLLVLNVKMVILQHEFPKQQEKNFKKQYNVDRKLILKPEDINLKIRDR